MSVAATTLSITQELETICGREHVCEDTAALARFAIDGATPGVSVAPGSVDEVAAILRYASLRRLAVVPGGGFTRQHVGRVPQKYDILLHTRRLTAVEHYDPGDLTIGIGASATIREMRALVTPHHHMFPVDCASPDAATIGGVIATAAHGPLRQGFSGVRDFLIGVRFVTGDGKIAKGGGRVVKNVAGYDLMKLMTGSYGTLGVITSASFKLFPAARQTRTFVAEFASADEAVAFRNKVVHSPLTPISLELASPMAAEFLEGAANSQERWRIFVRAAGSQAVLARYRTELGEAAARTVDGEAETRLWNSFSNFEDLVAQRHRNVMVVEVGVMLSKTRQAIAAAEQAVADHNFFVAAVGRIGLGSLVFALAPVLVDPPTVMQYADMIAKLRRALPAGSSAIVTRCPSEAKHHLDVWGENCTDLESMRKIKQALDPQNILNPGRFLV